MNRNLPLVALLVGLTFCSSAFGLQDSKKDKKKKDEYSLKVLFPKKSFFGPSASNIQFSADGRYAAYLYRPYKERRHGSDLWLYDFQTKKNTRLTSVSVLSPFQKSTRKVGKARIDAAKKAAAKKDTGKKEKKTKDKKDQSKLEKKWMDQVTEKDADDKKGPRYSGISSYTWHPKKNSMLVSTGGDVYQIAEITKPKLQRLTRTQGAEGQVQYLPEGNGFTFRQGDIVQQVVFGQHFVNQINPRLPSGRSVSFYVVSPDGKKIALVSQSGSRWQSGSRTVDVIKYRERFAKASKVPRMVSDDQMKPVNYYVHLFDFTDTENEKSELVEVFNVKIDEPRDIVSSPVWSPDSSKITFCHFNQKDHAVKIFSAQLPKADKKGKKESKGEKKNPAKVVYQFQHNGGPNTPNMVQPMYSWDSKHIVFVSEQSGFRHVNLLDPVYKSIKPLTSGNFEVYPIGMNKERTTLFVTATLPTPAQATVFKLDLKKTGKLDSITKTPGTYSSVAVSPNGKRVMANFVRYGQLRELVAVENKSSMKTITDSHPAVAKRLTKIKPEMFQYKNRHGHTIHGMMYKPDGWKKNQKRPLLIYVYGGPLGTRKSVTDGSYASDGYFFQSYVAKKLGYLTVVIDPRGQSGYGAVFENANFERVGKPQVEDLVDGVKFLTKEYGIDNKKVGIHGWSFGGFQTQMCLYTQPDVFQVGMAGAGPTEWENYNSWYSTGTIGKSRPGTPDQKKYSLRPLAKNLKGKLLLIHGIEDFNVLFQDTIAIYRELLKAGKETNVELFLDPTGAHGLGGDVKRLNRFRKYEEFLLRTLGKFEKK